MNHFDRPLDMLHRQLSANRAAVEIGKDMK